MPAIWYEMWNRILAWHNMVWHVYSEVKCNVVIWYDMAWYDGWHDMTLHDRLQYAAIDMLDLMWWDVIWCDVMWCGLMSCDAMRCDWYHDTWHVMIHMMRCDLIQEKLRCYDHSLGTAGLPPCSASQICAVALQARPCQSAEKVIYLPGYVYRISQVWSGCRNMGSFESRCSRCKATPSCNKERML